LLGFFLTLVHQYACPPFCAPLIYINPLASLDQDRTTAD
jgi:hypothetical protein